MQIRYFSFHVTPTVTAKHIHMITDLKKKDMYTAKAVTVVTVDMVVKNNMDTRINLRELQC